jgi:hypothetical protein
VNEKIQSLKSAQTVNDIKEVYPYIITEKDFSDAIKILSENNKEHLLEMLSIGEPEVITLRSGTVVEKHNNEYYYQGDIILTQEQLDLLSDPDFQMEPAIIDRNDLDGSILAYMEEKYPNIEFPDFNTMEKAIEEYQKNNAKDENSVTTRGAGLIGVPFMNYVWSVDCPYVISSSFSATERQFIQNAINTWNANASTTGITLVQRTNQTDYVEFIYGTLNASYIGKIGGKQTITLVQKSFSAGTVMHEIGHAFGLYHEHGKENRDKHVLVHGNNIQDGMAYAFVKRSTNCAQFDTFDYGSIMLYDSYAWSKNGQATLTKNDAARTTWVAQRVRLTQDDIDIIPKMKKLSVAATYAWILSGGGK